MTPGIPQPIYEEAFVEVVGSRVRYLHAGSGRPMLLIHGLVGSSSNWRNNIDALAECASVYAIDLVNMGKSQRIGGLDVGLKATADRIIAVMDVLGLAQTDIVAHSHGGAVVLMLAALHPKRVRRLILFAPANPYSRSTDLMVPVYSSTWGGLLAWTLPYLPTSIQRIALAEMYGGADRIVDSCLQEMVHGLRTPGTLRHVLCIIRSWFSDMAMLKTSLHRVKRIPTLLVWGDCDCTVSLSSAVELKRKLRASELIVLPGGGHSVFEEAPEKANSIMLEWLGRHAFSDPDRQNPRRVTSFVKRTKSTVAKQPLSLGN
jgi:4,5:9,10-diseco-3-hydroxy-5,9,17-trioxoandrosta-1(10),2-diene-4-oate hydrolase